jgi:hypothetical protein
MSALRQSQSSSEPGGARPAKLLEAIGRVGRSPEPRFRWLRDFVGRNLSAADLEAARWEIIAFAATGWDEPPAEPSDLAKLARRAVGGSRTQGPSLGDPDPSSAVGWAQHRAKRALVELCTHRRCRLPFIVAEGVWDSSGVLSPVPRADLTEDRPDLTGWFFGALFRLLAQLAPRLRICANAACHDRLFLPTTRRQRYCTSLCSNRVRAARYRENNPERVSEMKHRAYAHQQQRRLGKKVKVRRRVRGRRSAGSR